MTTLFYFLAILFYFLAIFPLMYEMMIVGNTKKSHKFIMNMKDKKVSDMTYKEKNFSTLHFFYFIWNIIGLFTVNWPVFSLIFFLALIPQRNIYLRLIDAFLTFLVLLFIIINYFHLNINTSEYFINYFYKFFA
jgi:hypothetical protein